jgi:hypothetical protein
LCPASPDIRQQWPLGRRGAPGRFLRILVRRRLVFHFAGFDGTAPLPFHRRFVREGDGAALAAGALGGLALGTVIGSAAAGPYYPGKPVGVLSPPPSPVYVEAYDESPACFIKRRRYVDEFGDVTVRRIRVCE